MHSAFSHIVFGTYSDTPVASLSQQKKIYSHTFHPYNSSMFYTVEFERFVLEQSDKWRLLAEDWIEHNDTLVFFFETLKHNKAKVNTLPAIQTRIIVLLGYSDGFVPTLNKLGDF